MCAAVAALDATSSNQQTVGALEHCRQAALSDGGYLFVARDGTITFHNRAHRRDVLGTPAGTLGDLPGEIPYQPSLVGQMDDSRLWNRAAVLAADGTRELIGLRAGRWPAPVILQQVAYTHRDFHSLMGIEDNHGQTYLVQMLSGATDISAIIGAGTTIPVIGLPTGRNKHDEQFGVISVGVEMERGKWAIPCPRGQAFIGAEKQHPLVRKLVRQLLDYNPRSHTGDLLMALWKARELARTRGGTRSLSDLSDLNNSGRKHSVASRNGLPPSVSRDVFDEDDGFFRF